MSAPDRPAGAPGPPQAPHAPHAASAPAVRLAGVAVDAGGKRILGPVDLAVRAGEHVLVVGPSGSGKSTLLRAIAGLEPLAAGRVELDGRLATDGRRQALAPHERGIGFLFQDGALWPHMSVARTLAFVLAHKGVPRGARATRVRELLLTVELGGYERRMPGTLSGGEAQRLALARALAMEPRVLLLDEPLGPLDAELRSSLLARLGALHAALGLTILHVTHDPGEAQSLADRLLHLRAGAIESEAAAAAHATAPSRPSAPPAPPAPPGPRPSPEATP